MTTTITDRETSLDTINQKLMGADTPGYFALFTDEEAAVVGAFDEDAISEEAAFFGSFDNPNLFDGSNGKGK